MARYTLDYSAPSPAKRRRAANSARWPLLMVLPGLCLGLIAFIYAYYLRAEHYHLRQQHNTLQLRYDSLLNVSQPPVRSGVLTRADSIRSLREFRSSGAPPLVGPTQ